MIAKRVPIKTLKKSNFRDLVNYLIRGAQGERVGKITITNCQSDTTPWAVTEIEAIQARNTRAKSDKTYHLILSFRENPSPDILEAIETRVCEGLGYAEHQRISVVHHDTEHWHSHIAINKIHPVRLTLHEPYYDHKKLADLCVALEREYGLQADNHTPGKTGWKAADMEAFSGTESLAGWIQREYQDAIRAATSWEDLHRTLAEQGLEVRLRGNGLIFAAQDGITVKASSIGRDFSKSKLEARLGAFVEASAAPESSGPPQSAGRRYQRRPLPVRLDTTELYARYQRDRQAGVALREQVAQTARERKEKQITAAKRASRVKRAANKLLVRGRLNRRIVYGRLSDDLRAELQAIHRQYRGECQAAAAQHPRQTWADWLQAQAAAGDAQALAVLRARRTGRAEGGDGLSGASRQPATGSAAGAESVTRSGILLYRVDGTQIQDDGEWLRIGHGASPEALAAGLRMAMERYGRVLKAEGSAEFRDAVVAVAARERLPVRFEDPALERQRAALTAARSTPIQPRGRGR